MIFDLLYFINSRRSVWLNFIFWGNFAPLTSNIARIQEFNNLERYNLTGIVPVYMVEIYIVNLVINFNHIYRQNSSYILEHSRFRQDRWLERYSPMPLELPTFSLICQHFENFGKLRGFWLSKVPLSCQNVP